MKLTLSTDNGIVINEWENVEQMYREQEGDEITGVTHIFTDDADHLINEIAHDIKVTQEYNPGEHNLSAKERSYNPKNND